MRRTITPWAVLFLLAGCATAGAPGSQQPPRVTPIAEAGAGVTVWKFPVLGIGLWGLGGLAGSSQPAAIIYQYSYQAAPKPTIAGVPLQPPGPPAPVPQSTPAGPAPEVTPAPPPGPVTAVAYSTIYPPAPFDDPTLIVFKNMSDRAFLEVSLDGGKTWVPLPAGQPSTDFHLGSGDHRIRVRGRVPTAQHGWLEVPERIIPIRIDARGHAQIFHLSE